MNQVMPDGDRLGVLQRLFEAFNRHDADGVMACFTPDVVFDAAAGPEAHGRRITGEAAVRAAFVTVWTDLPDVSWAVTRHTLAGERATSEWHFTGTSPDGRRIAVDGVDLFVFRDRLIARKSTFRKDRMVQPAREETCR